MTDFSSGIDAISRMVNMIEPLKDISAALLKINSIEAATTSSLNAYDKAKSDLSEANASLTLQEAKLAEAKDAFKQMLSDDNQKRLAIIEDAKTEAQSITDSANHQASTMIDDANTSINKQVAAAQSRLEVINSSIKQANADFKSISAASDQAISDAADAQAKLDAIKSQLAKMIG